MVQQPHRAVALPHPQPEHGTRVVLADLLELQHRRRTVRAGTEEGSETAKKNNNTAGVIHVT
jgi:hypothetical protein